MDRLDLKWAAASEFIRDMIEALGLTQPEPAAVVDLSSLALHVVGQIEELKAEIARLQQALDQEREAHHICTEGQQVMLDQMNRLQQALEVCAVPLEALRLVRERHSLPELSPEIQAAIMQATEVIRVVLADQVSR